MKDLKEFCVFQIEGSERAYHTFTELPAGSSGRRRSRLTDSCQANRSPMACFSLRNRGSLREFTLADGVTFTGPDPKSQKLQRP